MEWVKFSKHEPEQAGDPVPYSYGDRWLREATTGPERLLIGPAGRHIAVFKALARCLEEPWGVLYVLLLSRRRARQPGRYQCEEPRARAEVEAFLDTYRPFFEQDGRHTLWVGSWETDGLLVYDKHNVIYAYGPLERYECVLAELGFRAGAVDCPVPHVHHYHGALDEDEDAVMSYWGWRHFPLEPGDDPGRV